MNNEPPLILISKQLLIVYEAPTRWSTEEQKGRGKIGNKKRKEKSEGMEEQAQWPQNYYLIVIFFFHSGLAHMTDTSIQSPKSNGLASIYFLTFCIDQGAGCETQQLLEEHKTSLISWKRPEIWDSSDNKSSLLKSRILIEG